MGVAPQPTPDPTPGPDGDCIATPGLNMGVSDVDCAHCPKGRTWWPCNQANLCRGQCSAKSAPTPAPTPAPVGKCVATPGLDKGVSDSDCDHCPKGRPWWPCNVANLCQGQCKPAALMEVRQGIMAHKFLGVSLLQAQASLGRCVPI